MKTRKRLASLFLAMMMALSVMAMSASAYEESVIQPRKPALVCAACGNGMAETGGGEDKNGIYLEFSCTTWGCPDKGRPVKAYL